MEKLKKIVFNEIVAGCWIAIVVFPTFWVVSLFEKLMYNESTVEQLQFATQIGCVYTICGLIYAIAAIFSNRKEQNSSKRNLFHTCAAVMTAVLVLFVGIYCKL